MQKTIHKSSELSRKTWKKPIKNGEPSQATTCFEVLQATLSSAFRDTGAVLRLVLLGAGINAVLTPLAVVLLKGGTAGGAAWCLNLWGLTTEITEDMEDF